MNPSRVSALFTPFYNLHPQGDVFSRPMGNPGHMAGRAPLLAVVVLIFAPGLALGYVGFRGLAEREQSLQTTYTATTVLVRDRLAAELTRLESLVSLQPEPNGLAAL